MARQTESRTAKCAHHGLRCAVLFSILSCASIQAQSVQDTTAIADLKRLSFEELLNIEVTSVSMRPEKLTEVASAVQVITAEEIMRSAVTRLPEALRLVSNLQVAQTNSHDWAITARGFNGLPSAGGILANKLLVMIDGRTVYNPLFGGVYWDVQNVLLQDVDRIEVVSGPGGTLWGANAVNGVINIITKKAAATKGLYLSGGAGTFLNSIAEARYGFDLTPEISMRVYGQRLDQGNTTIMGEDAMDNWEMLQTGFRMDYSTSAQSALTVQGDLYKGVANESTSRTERDGQNVLARFVKAHDNGANLMCQVFYDRTWRETPNATTPFNYELSTFDGDVQFRSALKRDQSFLVGAAYRFQKDKTTWSLTPASRTMPLYSFFLQYENELVPQRLRLTIGSKVLHNVYTGLEVQPSGRIAWTPDEHQAIWSAISRAVRVPTRFDSDVTTGASKFNSERVTAFEIGYRLHTSDKLMMSVATFFNHYDELRSLDTTGNSSQPIILANSQKAESWGLEISGRYQVNSRWRLRAGYSYFEKGIWAVSERVHPASEAFEGVDPKGRAIFQSILDINRSFDLDMTGRYYSSLPSPLTGIPATHSYFTFDVRLAWSFKAFEVSIVGQNLLEENHSETGLSSIPRSVYGRITCRL